jgi:hypothetical protein
MGELMISRNLESHGSSAFTVSLAAKEIIITIEEPGTQVDLAETASRIPVRSI